MLMKVMITIIDGDDDYINNDNNDDDNNDSGDNQDSNMCVSTEEWLLSVAVHCQVFRSVHCQVFRSVQ